MHAGGKERIKAVLVLDTYKIMILKVICMRQNEILPHRKRGQNQTDDMLWKPDGWEPLCSILCLSRVTRLSPAKRHTLPMEYLMV